MKGFAKMKKHECVNAFFTVNSFTVNELVVKELLIPAIIAVMIREAVCE